MADKNFIVVIRKEVETYEEAQLLYEAVKTKLADKPGLKYTATFSNHFGPDESPPA